MARVFHWLAFLCLTLTDRNVRRAQHDVPAMPGCFTPTEILAEQHSRNISKMLASTQYNVELLTGSISLSRKREVQRAIQDGEVDLVVGTHALIQDAVKFHKLGFVVIDEQHRFGVMQRAELMQRGYNPDVLVMTATPIPRSLVMSVYGDLDLSVIDEMPPGRKPVITRVRGEESRRKIYKFLDEKIRAGSQVYIVYPLVEDGTRHQLCGLRGGYGSRHRCHPEIAVRVNRSP